MPSSNSQLPAPSISDTSTVNEVLARYPATIMVFNSYGVDTCCGGELSLRDAAIHARADRDVLLAALEAAACASLGGPRQGAA